MESKKVYVCSRCDESHNYEFEAEECCQPAIWEMWACSECDETYDTEAEADRCHEASAASCPVCARGYGASDIAFQAIKLAGHCSTCSPMYTIEEKILIEETHFLATNEYVDLSTGG